MIAASTILLLVFATLGAVDAIYIHLFRLRLYAREESWREHAWHTVRAVLFAPILLTVFLAPTTGIILWIGVALLAIDQIAELLDLRAEQDSRVAFGGVGRVEFALHSVLLLARAGAIAFALFARSDGAWSLAIAPETHAHPEWVTTVVRNLIPGAVLGALVHVWLAWKYRPRIACCRIFFARARVVL